MPIADAHLHYKWNCKANPKNHIVLAHAGAALPPAEVRRVLEACSNVWMDLSARDPWRFLRFPIFCDRDWRLRHRGRDRLIVTASAGNVAFTLATDF